MALILCLSTALLGVIAVLLWRLVITLRQLRAALEYLAAETRLWVDALAHLDRPRQEEQER